MQNFAKSLLDVADNLSRASSVVKESFSKIDASKDSAGAIPLLKTLLEGVDMTEKQLAEVLYLFWGSFILKKSYLLEKYFSAIPPLYLDFVLEYSITWKLSLKSKQVFKKFGVEKFDPLNEKFDPNRHCAVFQIPDPSKPSGTVASVVKVC